MEKTKIKLLKEGEKNVFIDNLEVIETKGIENWTIGGKPIEVVNATIKDNTGEIKISAWEGVLGYHKLLATAKRIDVENCFCKRISSGQFAGELQLTLGKFGRIKVLEKAEEKQEEPTQEELNKEDLKDELYN